MKTITEDVTKFILEMKYENLPPDVVDETKRILLGALGCAVAVLQDHLSGVVTLLT